jgi:hypothetical protein
LPRPLTRGLLPVLLASFAALVTLAATALPAAASGNYPTASGGYDISWPQCGGPYPGIASNMFGIVGVNDGTPQTENPCFGSEFRWAMANPGFSGVYLNVAYGTSYAGPLTCDPGDTGCQAYNYGWQTGEYAYVTALVNSGGASEDVPNWWLDVEVDNFWSSNPRLNTDVIQGVLDYFQDAQGIQAGVYSVSFMWWEIAGSYAPAGVPNWVAGGSDASDWSTCWRPIWSGGQVAMFQSLTADGMYDVDRGC